jgi:hypothetical protein
MLEWKYSYLKHDEYSMYHFHVLNVLFLLFVKVCLFIMSSISAGMDRILDLHKASASF